MNNNPIGLYLISFHYKTPSNSFYLLAPVISSTEVTETRYHMKAPSPKDRIHAGRIRPRGKDGNQFVLCTRSKINARVTGDCLFMLSFLQPLNYTVSSAL